MPTLNRDGVSIYYEVHGKGPAILLSHGYSATSQMWQGQIEPLSKSHTLITWDMRGHGQSDSPKDQGAYSEEATVGDMAAILDAVGAKKAIVGGLSLGGYMSLAFNLKYPDRVRALLIIDTGPGYRKDEPRAEWNVRAERTAQGFERDGLSVLKSRSKEMAMSTHRSAEGLARAARGMLAQRDDRVINSLPNIKSPSIVVCGSEDKPFIGASEYMAAKIPGARLVMIPQAGHAANIDQPKLFNESILGFIGQLPPLTA
jgi:pimeloyl-ACP methyl ester carboxylesterase